MIGQEKEIVQRMGSLTLIGTKDEVKQQINNLKQQIKFEELMVNTYIYDKDKFFKSYQLFSEAVKES